MTQSRRLQMLIVGSVATAAAAVAAVAAAAARRQRRPKPTMTHRHDDARRRRRVDAPRSFDSRRQPLQPATRSVGEAY